MKCALCRKEASVETPFGERHYCDRHFTESIGKRIRKDLRTKIRLNPKKQYSILNDDSHEYKLTKHFLQDIFKGRLKLNDVKKNPDLLPGSLDSEADEFLESFLDNTSKTVKAIVPLRTISQNEMKELCRILKIKFKAKKFNPILDELENKYPGTKFSTLKSKEFYKKNKKVN